MAWVNISKYGTVSIMKINWGKLYAVSNIDVTNSARSRNLENCPNPKAKPMTHLYFFYTQLQIVQRDPISYKISGVRWWWWWWWIVDDYYDDIETCIWHGLSAAQLAYDQGRSRRNGGAPAFGWLARGLVRTNASPPAAGIRGREPRIFVLYFNTKSCIVMHSLAPKMDITSVFIKTLIKTHWGKWRLLVEGRKSRPKAKSGEEFLGRGSKPHQLWICGALWAPQQGSGGALTAQRFFKTIFSTQDGLSWHYNIHGRRVNVFLITRVEGRVFGQPRHCIGINASRGVSAEAELLVNFIILVVLLYFVILVFCFNCIF